MYTSTKSFIQNRHKILYNISTIEYKKNLLKNKKQYCPYDYFEENFIKLENTTNKYKKENENNKQENTLTHTIPIPNKNMSEMLINNHSTHSSQKIFEFWTKADIKCDIYKLYKSHLCSTNDYIGNPLIPDYKSSIYMNNIFRDIKENKNIDALEESDDEFEKTTEDFVDLNKSSLIKYYWNSKFNKYYPVL